eukprot:TRINITY_DN13091_c0_g1_i1.p1 TRINITY_DN13091_c0_g1~~TRINITY_DN13091_c0_g1_i1.p1  ORF type:complete len:203 (+),score=35.47 TRINITY_DN13091_c0_g1_i1:185-793(+)
MCIRDSINAEYMGREQQLKEFRSKNSHLQNFQKVYDYRVNTLKEEKQPLKDHLHNMEQHVKFLYKELLDEASRNKKIMNDTGEYQHSIQDFQLKLKEKENHVAFCKRLLENFEYKIKSLVKMDQYKFEDWLDRLHEIYKEIFIDNSEKNRQHSKTDNDRRQRQQISIRLYLSFIRKGVNSANTYTFKELERLLEEETGTNQQ